MITDEITKDRLEQFASSVPSVPEIILRVKEISENPQSSAADFANTTDFASAAILWIGYAR